MTRQGKAYACAIVTVLLWSTVASAFKLSLRYVEPPQLLLYASLVSAVILAVMLAVQGRLGALWACTRAQYRRSFLLGFLNPFLYYLVLFQAYDLLPAQEAQPLNYTWALTLAVLSVPLLGQRLGWGDLAGGLLGYAGVVVISTHGNPLSFRFSDPFGVALALGSTVLWALYWIGNTRDDRDPVAGLLLNFLCAIPLIAGYCALFSSFRVTDPRGLLGAVYVGTFEMGVTFVTWLWALKLSENTARVGNLIFLSPFLSLLLIHFLVGESILPSTFLGLVLIVAGLLGQRFLRPRPAGESAPAPSSPPSAPRSGPPCA